MILSYLGAGALRQPSEKKSRFENTGKRKVRNGLTLRRP